MQLLLSGIINCTQLVGVITSLWTMDRFGRRPLLLTGAGLMFVCHLIIAVLVGKFGGQWDNYATEGWVAVAFLFFYMFSFGATWGPVPWAMPSEIFPSSLRAKGVALSTCSNWFNNFIIVSQPPTFYILYIWLWMYADISRASLPLLLSKTLATERTLFSQSSAFSHLCSRSSAFPRRLVSHLNRWMKCSTMSTAWRRSSVRPEL